MTEPDERTSTALIEEGAVRRLLRWMPFALLGHVVIGAPTLIISLVVAYGTYVQAQATQRMQQAAAWPFVAYDTTNSSDDGKHQVALVLANNGVGPAMLGPIEVRYRGQPVRSTMDLLAKCCGYRQGTGASVATSTSSNVVLRPGESISFLALRDVPENAKLIPQLDRERWRLQVRSCYCSIFDDCWTIEGRQAKPKPVKLCPTDWTVFRER